MELNRVNKRYGEQVVLQDFSLKLPSRGAVCLFGPSGCGKTTLLRLLSGLEKPQSGQITVLRPGRTAMVFQEDRLIESVSPLRNVELGGADRPRALALLEKLGLGERELTGKRTRELSGGMQRRIALARALAFGGELYLLDEPFKGLDEAVKEKAIALFRQAARQALVLFSTHDRGEAVNLADQVLLLSGPPLRIERVFSGEEDFPLEKATDRE